MTPRKKPTNYQVRTLCIKNDWFTGGSNEQYEKMFELLANDDEDNLRDVALIIWVCSNNVSVDDIYDELLDCIN